MKILHVAAGALFLGLIVGSIVFASSMMQRARLEKFRVHFGILKETPSGDYRMDQETTTIPCKLKDRGFFYGVAVDPPDQYSYDFRTVTHLPSPPKIVTGNLQSVGNDLVEPSVRVSGEGVQAFNFDEGDPLGPESIDIYVNDRLLKTIQFNVVADGSK